MATPIKAQTQDSPWSTEVLQSCVDQASSDFQVPSEILYAIMQVESGIWPWTVHVQGKGGYYFLSKKEAIDFALDPKRNANHNINVGLMQIHWPTHKYAIKDIAKSFDPQHNIRYAAKLLQDLKGEFGTWEKAVKAYHSRITRYGNIYGEKISKELGFPLDSM